MVNYFSSSISTPKHKLHFLQLPVLRPADHTQQPSQKEPQKELSPCREPLPLPRTSRTGNGPCIKKKKISRYYKKYKIDHRSSTLNTQSPHHLPPCRCEVTFKRSVVFYKEASCWAQRKFLDWGTRETQLTFCVSCSMWELAHPDISLPTELAQTYF